MSSVSFVYMPFAYCYVVNWYEDKTLVETSLLKIDEFDNLMQLLELVNKD